MDVEFLNLEMDYLFSILTPLDGWIIGNYPSCFHPYSLVMATRTILSFGYNH